MKLIDRDKFISDMFDLYIEQKWKPSDIHFSLLDVRSNIDFKGYEVKAIPIEWIEKWLDKTTGTRDGEDISQLPEQLKFAIGMINLMEMEWKKENGTEESTRNI